MESKDKERIQAGLKLYEELLSVLPTCSHYIEVRKFGWKEDPIIAINIHQANSDHLVKLLKYYRVPIRKNSLKTLQTAKLQLKKDNHEFEITVFPEKNTWRGCQLKIVGYKKETTEYPIYEVRCTSTIKNPSKRE